MRQSLAAFSQKQFGLAAAGFDSFLEQYPDSPLRADAWFWLGNCRYALRQYEGAIQSFERMLREHPGHPKASEAWLGIANARFEMRQGDQARAIWARVARDYPDSAAASVAQERLRSPTHRTDAERNAEEKRVNLARLSVSENGTGRAAPQSSVSYAQAVATAIRPNILYPELERLPAGANPAVDIDVQLAPNGDIVGAQVVRPSGVPEWDEAALRGVRRTEHLPLNEGGNTPSRLLFVLRPRL